MLYRMLSGQSFPKPSPRPAPRRSRVVPEAAVTARILLLARSLLLGNRRATRTFPCPGVGVRALASHRKSSPVTKPSIAADIHQPLDVHLHLLTEIAFDHTLLVDHHADPIHFVFTQLTNPTIDIHSRFGENLVGARATDSVDICQTNLSSLVCWQVHT